jgi:hypothetical protein
MIKLKTMPRINFLTSIMLLLAISLLSNGQIAIGQWRDHLPYNQGSMITVAGDKVYLVTNVGMFSYNKNSGETQKLSKITGLSDSGAKSVRYHKETGILFVGYSNGNIDLIIGNEIFNIPDIKRKSMPGDKTIYNIRFIDNFAYLACGFGIVELNLDRKEIRNTFFIGDLGSNVKVNDIAYDGEFLYAASDNGIYKGRLSDFLVDFANWEIITDINSGAFSWMKESSFNNIVSVNNMIITNYYNPEQANTDSILVFDGSNWSHFPNSPNSVESIEVFENQIIIAGTYWVKTFDSEFNETSYLGSYADGDQQVSARPAHAIMVGDRDIWIADKNIGMANFSGGWRTETYSINGPSSNNIFKIAAAENTVIGIAGGMNLSWSPLWRQAITYVFENETWNSSATSTYRDLVSIAIHPDDPNHFFAGSWLNGLIEYKNHQIVNVYNNLNSTISNVGSSDYFRVGGLAFDSQKNLWLTNSLTNPPISVMDTEGNWTGLDYFSIIGNTNLGDIIITRDNIKWVVMPRGGGLFVFDDNGTPNDLTDDRVRKLSIISETGEIISNEVFSIAEDKNGYIWVGTNKGIAVYYSPENVFDDPNFHARQIKIPRNDGTDNADILLGTEIVTSITVDGANRKWFGTSSAGVFYTSADGLEQIHHFNTDNSPMISNNILCITVNPTSGEVFFGTGQGIISYRATATEGSEDYHQVYAFPNPVRPDYDGPITITGLVAGSYVKITDISGNLVYETRSEGGQAVWNGKNKYGDRVQTGVYLVFSSNDDGSKTDITKILFIN